MNKYTTIQGDMWDSIAKKLYGTEMAMNVLLEANQQYNSELIQSSATTSKTYRQTWEVTLPG